MAQEASNQSPVAEPRVEPSVVDLDAATSLDGLAERVAGKRVVFIGESHDRYDHHLNQLEIIQRLHRIDPHLALGVEYFQQPFQQQLDDYIAGRTTEDEFLRTSDYFEGWGYDYRLYAPIFRFAREQHIPVRALNVPVALPRAIAKSGIAGLSPQERAYLPKEIVPADEDYKNRLRPAFEGHGSAKPGAFDHFVEAQLVWDEAMAESAATYLNANPGRKMVILAGSGHIVFGAGIPQRLERRTHAAYAIVLNNEEDLEARMGDYLVLGKSQELPPAGALGVNLEAKKGFETIRSLSPGGAAEKAGLKKGDVLLEVEGQPIHKLADLRVVLWDKKPGDRVRVNLRPKHGAPHTLEVALTAPAPAAEKR